MPSIQDMGLAAAFQPTPNMVNDPSILLSALALRERQRTNRTDEKYRDRAFDRGIMESDRSFTEGVRQFDTKAKIDNANLGMRRKEFNQRSKAFDVGMEDRTRQLGQEAASQGMFADLAEEMGVFRKQGPDGVEYSIPGMRDQFLQMAPDDQQRAIGMHAEEQQTQQIQAQVGKFGTMVESAAAGGFLQPEEAQVMLAAVQANPANAGAMYGQVLGAIQDKAQQQMLAQQRQEQVAGTQATLQALQQSGILRPEIAAAHLSRLMVDPDAKPAQIIKDAMADAEKAETDMAMGAEIRKQQSIVSSLQSQFEAMTEAARVIPAGDAESRKAMMPQIQAMLETLGRERAKFDRLVGRSEMQAGPVMAGDPGYSEAHASLGLTRQEQTPEGLRADRASVPTDDDIDAAIAQARAKLGKKAKAADIEAEVERILNGAP